MEKNGLGSIFIYLIMLALIYLVGQTVILLAIKSLELTASQAWPYVIICIVISIVIFAIVYELGHVIGAKIGRYKVIYFNILGLCLYKDDKKWKFKFDGFEGLFGETRFAPVHGKRKPNPKWFLSGGLIFFLVSVVIALSLYMIEAIPLKIRYGTLIYFGVGLVFVLYNIIPMKTDILNDGYRWKLLGKKENAEAYNDFMVIEDQVRHGKVPENIKVYENISPMTVLINNYAYYENLKNKNYKRAEEIVDIILNGEKDLDSTTKYRYRFQKLFFIILNNSIEDASKYYWDLDASERKSLSKDNYISSKRVYLLVSGLINESLSESKLAINGVKKRINRIVDKTQKEVEMELFNECIKKVEEKLQTQELSQVF